MGISKAQFKPRLPDPIPNLSPEYLIEGILPSREISLVAGASGAGKTTWLLNTLLTWSAGLSIYGHKSHPVPWYYASADRSIDAVRRLADHMQLDKTQIEFIPAWDSSMTINNILDKVPPNSLLAIENFASFVDGGETKGNVTSFLNALIDALKHHHITVIGVMEAPKKEPTRMYKNPRQRVAGPATWGHRAETVFYIDHVDEENPGDPRRKLYISVHAGGAGRIVPLRFSSESNLVFDNNPDSI